jgi:hypothetical protein
VDALAVVDIRRGRGSDEVPAVHRDEPDEQARSGVYRQKDSPRHRVEQLHDRLLLRERGDSNAT